MKYKLLALSSALLACGVAHAQSSVTVYGIIDQGVDVITNVQTMNSAGKRVGRTLINQMSSIDKGSRLGFRGVEDLGGGLKAIFTLENGFDTGTGKAQQGGDMFGRQAFVGLASPYGTLTLGRQYDAIIDAVQPAGPTAYGGGGPFVAHGEDMDNISNNYRVNNAIKYTSPKYYGFTVIGLYGFGNQSSSFSQQNVMSLGVAYNEGPIKAGVAITHAHEPNLSYWGNTASSSATSTNLGPIEPSGVQQNPVYGGFASARGLNIVAAGLNYRFNTVTVGAAYSNVRFSGLGDPGAGSLASTNPLGYHGLAVFNDWAVYGVYDIRPDLSFVGIFNYLTGGAINGKPPAHYNQFSASLHYLFSKRTGVYVLGTYQTAMGVDSSRQRAVAGTVGVTPSNGPHQFIGRVALQHMF